MPPLPPIIWVIAVVPTGWCGPGRVVRRPGIRILYATIAADQTVIAIASAVRTVLDATVPADQTVVAVVSAVRLIVRIRSGNVTVKVAIGAVVAIGVIGAVRSKVGVCTRTVAVIPGPQGRFRSSRRASRYW